LDDPPARLTNPDDVHDWIDQIQWYIARINETRGPRRASLLPDELAEIIELNTMRAIEASMDLAVRIHEDLRLEVPWQTFPYVRDYRRQCLLSIAEICVIDKETADCLVDMAKWQSLAQNEYWHLSGAYQDRDLDRWLAALDTLITGVIERFALTWSLGWEDSSGRDHPDDCLVPLATSGNGHDRDDIQPKV